MLHVSKFVVDNFCFVLYVRVHTHKMDTYKMEKLTIVQGNDLLEGAYRISIDEFRLLNIALTKVDSRESQPDHSYLITPQEFKEVYGLNNPHSKLKEAAIGLLKKPITLFHYDEKKGKVMGTVRPWFSLIEYDAGDAGSSVKLYFSEYVRPYLYELKKNFTSVTFKNVAALDTAFAVRLYYWLSKAKNLKSHNKGELTEVELNLDWMKNRAGLEGKYEDFRICRRRLIQPAVDSINRETDLSVMFEPVKDGKKVVAIKFIYLNQELKFAPTKRERLPRRPKVKKGTHEEGLWARECINIMTNHKSNLEQIGERLPLSDCRKLLNWYKIIGDSFSAKDVEKEINERKRK